MAAPLPGHVPWVAVVDDDVGLREDILVPAMANAGFQAHGMGSALDLYRAKTVRHYDLVLLNAELPDEDGFSIARHLRRLPRRVGIAMLGGVQPAGGFPADVDIFLPRPVSVEAVVDAMRNLAGRWRKWPAERSHDGNWTSGHGASSRPMARAFR